MPKPSKRPAQPLAKPMTKGERTRESIVAAAAPIFNQRGYEGSSLRDLMEATGLEKGGIYRHFASKEELAAAAFDYTWDAVWSARILHVDENAIGLERVRQLIANFVKYRSPVAGGCPLLNTAVEADDGDLDVLRARASKALKMWVNWLRDAITEAVETREARRDADAVGIATNIVASLEGALMISRLERSDAALKRMQDHLFRYLETDVMRLA